MQWLYVAGAGSGAVGGAVHFMGSNQNIRRRKTKQKKKKRKPCTAADLSPTRFVYLPRAF